MDNLGPFKKLSRYWPVIALPVVAVLCTLLAVRIVGSMDYHHNNNDFFTFWLAGHLVTQGGSPYGTAQWGAGYHQFEIGFIYFGAVCLVSDPLDKKSRPARSVRS